VAVAIRAPKFSSPVTGVPKGMPFGVDCATMPIPPENDHFLNVLKTTMRVLGFSNRDLERQLGLSGSYLSRLFSGDMELRFQHVVDLARAMGLEPEEVVRLAYPETEPPSAAAQRLWPVLGLLPPPAVDPEDTPEARLTRALERVFLKIREELTPLAARSGAPEPAPEPAPKEKSRPRRRKRGAGRRGKG
jgi:transcriptional regulator with XRE-family HTH domain